MIRKTTIIIASGDADTQWRRISKSAELRAEHPTERGDKAKINKALIEMLKDFGVEKEYLENGSVIKDVMHATDFLYSLRKSL